MTTLSHPLKIIAINFVLTYGTARAIAEARDIALKTLPPKEPADGEPSTMRFRVSVSGHLYDVSAYVERIDSLGEPVWERLDANCASRFGGSVLESTAIIGLAFQRLMQMVREQVSHTVVNDGQAIKYDLGVL